jgi:hypothetical protein
MATTTTTHKTRRGELVAKLGAKKIAAGHYEAAGYTIKMIREASGSRPGLWLIRNISHELAEVPHLTAALEMINEWVEKDAATTASAEVEIVDETPAPVPPAVPAEPIGTEVQEDVAPVPAPVKKTKKAKTYRTRRAELLDTLGAREVATAEYHVAGHHVEYVAPGVMPRNAGGRWRTTLLNDEGVVVSWNLSLTAALEVVAARVAEFVQAQVETAETAASVDA